MKKTLRDFNKTYFVLLLFLLQAPSDFAFATAADSTVTRGEVGRGCSLCSVATSGGPRLRNNTEVIIESMNDIKDKLDWGGKCDGFVEDRKLGRWALTIRDIFINSDFSELKNGPKDIQRLCPTYVKMKPTDKANFWVLIMSAMSHYESTCNTKAGAKGPNGSLDGLLQLHRGKEARYSSGCKNGDGQTARGTFRCALSMLDDQVSRDNNLFSNKSYWDVLRPKAKSKKSVRITKAVKSYIPCFDESKLNAIQQNEKNELLEMALESLVIDAT